MIFWLEHRGMRYRIHEGETLVGRGSRVAFFLDEPSVSREHALVRRSGTSVAVTDLKSSNGTFVNGERVQGSKPLQTGDIVCFGTAALRFGTTLTAPGPSVSPGIEFIEQQSSRPQVAEVVTEPAFGSIEVLETLVASPETAESLPDLASMVRASVARLLASAERGRVVLGPAERSRLAGVVATVGGWPIDDANQEWADDVLRRLQV
ncbi:MAG: FHA domain-containing protein [Polyangiaceae bacterium]|nr:FHA domain-containing protein [Polyangiaceae bacterium]